MTADTLTALPPLGRHLAAAVSTAMNELRPKLVHAALTRQTGEHDNLRHTDNFLSEHDLWMHQRYQTLLQQHLDSFVYASEEAEPTVVGPDPNPDLCILVDPLDTSELAVRALAGYTHVMAYSRSLRRPVATVIGDLFHHINLWIATYDQGSDNAYLHTADGTLHKITNSASPPVNHSIVTNFLMKPAERFSPLAAQHQLLDAIAAPGDDGKSKGRIGVDFGSIGLCHVAAGFTDIMVEFAKGFAIWDLAPGHHVLHAAGGVVTDLHGNPLSLDYRMSALGDIAAAMNGRQTFVAARDQKTAAQVAHLLQP